eukprot:348042-Prorocentrum_lima.AAC.1
MLEQLKVTKRYTVIASNWYQWIIHHDLLRSIPESRLYPVASTPAGYIMECLFGIAAEEMRWSWIS